MSGRQAETTQAVRRQYENLPYPPRDPQEERHRLIRLSLDHLSLINHYCFGGRQDFRTAFRVLVAGGGTGDAVVYLGEQLRQTDAEIVYVDLSASSMDIARRRAAVRGLQNVTWLAASLLDLPRMGLAPFDYVDCVGVLHHLESPRAGLQALRAALKDTGAMKLMVYGKYGRAGVYQMQELLRIVNRRVEDDQAKVENAKAMLKALPETNWFKKGESLFPDHVEMGDAGVYDLLLHSRDVAFSIPEVYELVEGCGLHLVTFDVRERAICTPGVAYDDGGLLRLLAGLPVRDRQAALELLNGTITKHSFYVSPREDTVARGDDADNVPFFHLLPDLGRRLNEQIQKNPGHGHMSVSLPKGIRLEIDIGPCTAPILQCIDGKRTLREIVALVGGWPAIEPSRDDVLAEFGRLYELLNLWDLLLLRHSSASPPEPPAPLGTN